MQYGNGGSTVQFDTILVERFDGAARITLNRPERRNPLTFESYAELRDLFRGLTTDSIVRAVVMSFQKTNLVAPAKWVGLENFQYVLTDPDLRAPHPGAQRFPRPTLRGRDTLPGCRDPRPGPRAACRGCVT